MKAGYVPPDEIGKYKTPAQRAAERAAGGVGTPSPASGVRGRGAVGGMLSRDVAAPSPSTRGAASDSRGSFETPVKVNKSTASDTPSVKASTDVSDVSDSTKDVGRVVETPSRSAEAIPILSTAATPSPALPMVNPTVDGTVAAGVNPGSDVNRPPHVTPIIQSPTTTDIELITNTMSKVSIAQPTVGASELCRFGFSCNRRGCTRLHPSGRSIDSVPAASTTVAVCKFGFSCHRKDCYFSHPAGRAIDG